MKYEHLYSLLTEKTSGAMVKTGNEIALTEDFFQEFIGRFIKVEERLARLEDLVAWNSDWMSGSG